MKYYIIIPAHNEEAFLAQTLDSILVQSLLPDKVVVVNDNSTDGTESIIDSYIKKNELIRKVNTMSSTSHMPGSKVVNAFNKGYNVLDENYDFIVKLDADIILPPDYFNRIADIFAKHPKVGIAGGFVYEQNSEGAWELNHPMDKNHVRGAFKAYRKNCFLKIGGLKSAMGWDTVDELLAQYHGFEIYTDDYLQTKHLRPIGRAYHKKARLLQGEAMYRMRYGFLITLIASLKMATKKQKFIVFSDNLKGYQNAHQKNLPFLVTSEEGRFIRKLRWNNIRSKILS